MSTRSNFLVKNYLLLCKYLEENKTELTNGVCVRGKTNAGTGHPAC
jgi:hypothetical protein